MAAEHLDEKGVALVIPVESHAFSKQTSGNPDAHGRYRGDIAVHRASLL
jgi:hypothetical protein